MITHYDISTDPGETELLCRNGKLRDNEDAIFYDTMDLARGYVGKDINCKNCIEEAHKLSVGLRKP